MSFYNAVQQDLDAEVLVRFLVCRFLIPNLFCSVERGLHSELGLLRDASPQLGARVGAPISQRPLLDRLLLLPISLQLKETYRRL